MVRSTQSGTNRSFRCFRREIYRAIVETVPTGSYLVRYTLKGPCIAVLIVSFVGTLAYLVPLVGTPMVVRVWMDFEVVMSTILIWIVFGLRFLFMRYWYFYDRWCGFDRPILIVEVFWYVKKKSKKLSINWNKQKCGLLFQREIYSFLKNIWDLL